jgi:hypothetical protein
VFEGAYNLCIGKSVRFDSENTDLIFVQGRVFHMLVEHCSWLRYVVMSSLLHDEAATMGHGNKDSLEKRLFAIRNRSSSALFNTRETSAYTVNYPLCTLTGSALAQSCGFDIEISG